MSHLALKKDMNKLSRVAIKPANINNVSHADIMELDVPVNKSISIENNDCDLICTGRVLGQKLSSETLNDSGTQNMLNKSKNNKKDIGIQDKLNTVCIKQKELSKWKLSFKREKMN